MGHYAAEMGYQTFQERWEDECRRWDEARARIEEIQPTFRKDDRLVVSSDGAICDDSLIRQFPWLPFNTFQGYKVKRIKYVMVDDKKRLMVSFMTIKEKRAQDKSMTIFKETEWHDARYFEPGPRTIKKAA